MTTKLVQQARVRTNITKDSVCNVNVEAVTFAKLWSNYARGEPYRDPKTGDVPPGFENQCAIQVSVTLHRVGIEMKSFNGQGKILLDGKRTAIRAEELAEWLKRQPFCGLPPRPENITGTDWQNKIKDRTGIVFFSDYWARPGQAAANADGDHIDLWNKKTLTPSLQSFIRFYIGRSSVFSLRSILGNQDDYWMSDLGKSKEILFWEIK
jgi:hypothetical protein